MNKRILCLIDGLGSGGAQRQIVGLANLLKQEGYYVDLGYYHEPNFYSAWLEEKGINVIKLPLSSNRFGKLLTVRKIISNNKYDNVIAYMGGPAIICCVLKMMGYKFKLIVSERNVTQVLNFGEKMKFLSFRWADIVTANSYTQTEYIKQNFNFLSDKTKCITNFVDLQYFSPTNISFDEKVDKIILVVGRISHQKNIPNFLQALSLIREKSLPIKVKWYGDYDKANNGEILYNHVIELREMLGLTDMIDFFPASTEIVNEYRSCDIFCLPSKFEGFPNVICEAMSCGKPILCSRVCDNPMIVSEGDNGLFFDPSSPEDIAASINRICLMSSSELESMGRKSREIAEKKFSPTVFVNKYIELI